MDEASSGAAKDALHNYKLDGENKIKASLTSLQRCENANGFYIQITFARK